MYYFLLALILYLPTTFVIDPKVYLLFIPIFIWKNYRNFGNWFSYLKDNYATKSFLKVYGIFALILLLIGGNLLFGGSTISTIIDSPIFFAPLLFMSAYLISDLRVIKYLLIFVAVESFVGFLEYCAGTNTFFTFLPRHFNFLTYDSLYHTRVFGFSFNSSNLAQKVFVSLLFLLLVELKFSSKQKIGLFVLFATVMMISFGRTVIIASFVLFSVVAIRALINKVKANREKLKSRINVNGIMAISSVVLMLVFSPFLVDQLGRSNTVDLRQLQDDDAGAFLRSLGLEGVEMAGRKPLWEAGINSLIESPILGNHSERFLLNGSHMHNSFIEFSATHGLIIFGLMVTFILLNLNKRNWWLIFFISLYSMGQFGIFWNISFLDVLFLSSLIYLPKLIQLDHGIVKR